jgi:hypothetical protein
MCLFSPIGSSSDVVPSATGATSASDLSDSTAL